jgi:hypothetical protein
VKFKFWHDDGTEEEVERTCPFYPSKDDDIKYKGRWWKVSTRALDLDSGRYTKAHCKPYRIVEPADKKAGEEN